MSRVKVKANAKVNLHLKITGKRADGYHELETIFQEIPLHDNLDINLIADGQGRIIFEDRGISIPGKKEDNICVKIARWIQKKYNITDSISIKLEKNIPIGAGLGGGSSDGAAVFKSLNTLLNLNLAAEEMEKESSKFGADVSFFIKGGCVFARGIGEIMTKIKPIFKDKYFLVVYPKLFVDTAKAYKLFKNEFFLNNYLTWDKKNSIFDTVSNGHDQKLIWRRFENDFERVVFEIYPEVKRVKEALSEGCIYASMTGSGSSVFGVYDSEELVLKIKDRISSSYFAKIVNV